MRDQNVAADTMMSESSCRDERPDPPNWPSQTRRQLFGGFHLKFHEVSPNSKLCATLLYDSISNVSNRIDSTLFDTIRKGACLVSLGRRLAEVRRKAALNQIEFALHFGVSQSAYKNYERDATEPPVHLLADICEKYDVNLNWLATGVGAQDAVNLKELSRRALIAVENHLNAKEVELATFKKADLMSFVLEYLISHPDASEKFLASIMETFVGDEANKQG